MHDDLFRFFFLFSPCLSGFVIRDSSSSTDDEDDEVPQPAFTDSAATPATAASTSSSPEVADCCEVCLLLPRSGVALVPCGLVDIHIFVRRVLIQWQQWTTAVLCAAHVLVRCCASTTDCV